MTNSRRLLVFHSPNGCAVPRFVSDFAEAKGLNLVRIAERERVTELVGRVYPAVVVLDGTAGSACTELCHALKMDPFSAIVPIVVLAAERGDGTVLDPLEAGADEVLTHGMDHRERVLRLLRTLQRANRDVSVNPTTLLPGTAQIERDISDRLHAGATFAVCYADLDHFKEFNDYYGYRRGDHVVLLVSRILRDVVRARAPTGFIGHIGGDDFIFNVPLEAMRICCEEVLDTFDLLIPFQYGEEDRERGFISTFDRQGTMRRIPIMTLSIGVVANEQRRFSHTAEMSGVASEMKQYAKTLSGSVYAVDRRSGEGPVSLAVEGTTVRPFP